MYGVAGTQSPELTRRNSPSPELTCLKGAGVLALLALLCHENTIDPCPRHLDDF